MIKHLDFIKNNLFILLLLVVVLVLSINVYLFSIALSIIIKIVLFLLLIPPVIYLVKLLLKRYHNNSALKLSIITKLIVCLVILIYYGTLTGCIGLYILKNPITNKKYYSFYMNNHLTKVFPKKIPSGVDNIKFYYSPGIMQDSTEYYLYYVDKSMTLDKFNALYKEKSIWVGNKIEYNDNDGLLAGVFISPQLKDEDEFIIYLVEGKCDKSGYCNHGNYLLTAYNEKTNEILYKSSEW